MISLTIEDGRLIVTARKNELAPTQESQLAYGGLNTIPVLDSISRPSGEQLISPPKSHNIL